MGLECIWVFMGNIILKSVMRTCKGEGKNESWWGIRENKQERDMRDICFENT